jgi:hypothetical protein
VPTQQLKDILGKFGVRFNGKKPTQIIISPKQAKNTLDAITQSKQPTLPKAQGKDIVPIAPRNNNKIIDIPVVGEKAQRLSVVPKNTTIPGRTMGSAGKADIGINNATLSIRPTPITRALVPVSKPSRALVPKTIQPKRNALVVAKKARAEVDAIGLKSKAKEIEIPEKERLEREEMVRERDRLERERDEQRREEELRKRDREREETEKEISKRNKRARRGDRQRAEQLKDPVGRQSRARVLRNIADIPSDQVIVIPHQPHQPEFPTIVGGNPIGDDNEPRPTVSGYFPVKNQQDPRIADYLNILSVARTSTAQLIQNQSIRMDLRWAHAEDPGIAAMLNAFNGCVEIIVENSKDIQLTNDDVGRKCDLSVMMQSTTYFETIKTKIANEMVRLLATMGIQA